MYRMDAMQNAAKVTATLDVSRRDRLPASAVEADQRIKQWAGPVGGVLVVAFGLTSVVAAVFATMAYSQLKAATADVSTAREELMLVQEHATRLEKRLDKVVQDFDQRQAKISEQAPNNVAKEDRIERPAFQLTQEETQLIRSHIKASPVTADAAATISVGAELNDATLLPLPSQIAMKSPRLTGSRFKIDRNGAIVIALRKSRQADVVIRPN